MGTFIGGRHLTLLPRFLTANAYVPHPSQQVLINYTLLVDRHSDVTYPAWYPLGLGPCRWVRSKQFTYIKIG